MVPGWELGAAASISTTASAAAQSSIKASASPRRVMTRVCSATRLASNTGAERLVRKIDMLRGDVAQILLDAQLILRGGRHDTGTHDGAVGVDLIAMMTQAARGLKRLQRQDNVGEMLRAQYVQLLTEYLPSKLSA